MKSTWLMVYIVSINLLLAAIAAISLLDTWSWRLGVCIAFTITAAIDLFIGLIIFNAVQRSTAWSKGFLASSWTAALVAGIAFSLPFLLRIFLYPFI